MKYVGCFGVWLCTNNWKTNNFLNSIGKKGNDWKENALNSYTRIESVEWLCQMKIVIENYVVAAENKNRVRCVGALNQNCSKKNNCVCCMVSWVPSKLAAFVLYTNGARTCVDTSMCSCVCACECCCCCCTTPRNRHWTNAAPSSHSSKRTFTASTNFE